MKKMVYTILAVMVVIACNSEIRNDKLNGQTNAIETSKEITPEKIEVRIVENYFPKKGIVPNVTQFFTITNQAGFDEHFGVGKTMTNEPTKIDFTKDIVGVVLMPETNKETNIRIKKMEKNSSTVKVQYTIEEGDEQSFTTVPTLIFKIPATDEFKMIEFESGKKDTNIINVQNRTIN